MEENQNTEPTQKVEGTEEVKKVLTVEELASQLEQIKKAQAGSDKAYQEAAKKAAELAAENEKLKKEKMTEKERVEFELAKQKAEIEAKEREVHDATLHLSKVRLLGAKKLPLEFADFVTGANEAELEAKLDTLNKLVESEVGRRIQEKLLSGKKPEAQQADVKPGLDIAGKSFKELEELAKQGKL